MPTIGPWAGGIAGSATILLIVFRDELKSIFWDWRNSRPVQSVASTNEYQDKLLDLLRQEIAASFAMGADIRKSTDKIASALDSMAADSKRTAEVMSRINDRTIRMEAWQNTRGQNGHWREAT